MLSIKLYQELSGKSLMIALNICNYYFDIEDLFAILGNPKIEYTLSFK